MLINSSKHIYLVGIKGVGMTALAQILQSQGRKISGSDTYEKFFTDKVLKKLKIPFKEGFRASNLPKSIELLIYSTAFDPKNHPEIKSAREKNIPLISYPQAVSSLFNNSLGIAISGTHGKTTTSAIIAESMKNLGLKPTALIGSKVTAWKTNALTGSGPYFVIEADEHQNKLRFYSPWSIVLTNIDYDHPDFYKKESDYYNAFKSWIGKWAKAKFPLPKIGIFNGDDPKIKRLMRELKLKTNNDCLILTYGKRGNCNFRILKQEVGSRKQNTNSIQLETNFPKNFLDLENKKRQTITVPSSLIGEHNTYNLAAAYGFVSALLLLIRDLSNLNNNRTLPPKIEELLTFASKSFKDFQGTERRMQYKGRRGNVSVFDDYGHHPSEIRATLSSFRQAYPKHQIFVIFQPHTYTRTVTFLKDFAKSLKIADQIGFLEIYGSARESHGKISSEDIAKLIDKKKCSCFSTHKDCLKYLNKYKFNKPTILVTMGAGDGWRVGEDFLKF